MERPSILIVEDEQIVAAALRKRLEALGYQVAGHATSGEQVVAMAECLRPNLVLMDIRLDGSTDGVDAAAIVRGHFQVPVVYLTAYSNQEVLDRAKITEPYGYILKPYDDRELHVVIEMALCKHQLERELQARDRWFAATFRSIGDGIAATDDRGRISFLNPAAERLTGWTSAEAGGRAIDEVLALVHEQTRKPVEAPLHQAMRERTNVPLANHTVLVARDGVERPVEDCATPIIDEQGETLGGVMVFRDISERHQSEREARTQREFLRRVMDLIPGFVVVKDRDSRFIMANRATANAYGTTVEDLVGKRDADFNRNPDEVAAFATADRQVIDTKIPRTIADEKITLASGAVRWLQTTKVPLIGPDGACTELLAVAVDVTERKNAEQATARLAAIVESAEDAIIGETPDGTITSWNKGAERIYGYTAREILGRSKAVLFPEERFEELRSILERVNRGERIPAFATLRRRKDGSLVDVLVTVSPVLDPAGQVIGAATIQHDVTNAKRLEHQFHQAQRMEAVGRLAGGVAHDFNNLLTVINGYSQMLLEMLQAHDNARELVEEINKAGERAAGLTRQLLAYSRKQIQRLKEFDLNDLVASSEKMLRRMLGEDVELLVVAAASLCPVKADPGQIEQVLMNLAVNARDAMPTGGQLTIETQMVQTDEATAVQLFAMPPGAYVLLAVTDTGHGMDEATLSRVFEPFFTTKEEGRGTGLGLATVYGIVKQSAGYVKIYSEVDHGTSVKVYLPCHQGPTNTSGFEPGEQDVPGGEETILLVEDEDTVRGLTQKLLRQCGYTVLAAPDGLEALNLLAQQSRPIDLLITDVVMPKMSGRQVAEAVRLRYPDLPVLYLSGYTDDAIFRHGVLQSETAFLQKPFTRVALARKVREVLDTRAGRAEPA